MPDSLISNHTAYVAPLRGCPSCPDRLSAIAGMRSIRCQIFKSIIQSSFDERPAAIVWRITLPREENCVRHSVVLGMGYLDGQDASEISQSRGKQAAY